ncbi:MAG: DUF1501 domain-containing protein [Pirellulaceae bacterium]
MLEITGNKIENCEGLSRRTLLKVGALGLGGLTLPQLLAWRSAARAAGKSMPETSVIFVEMAGGPTHMETYDPKPDSPIEYRGPLGVTPTTTPGVYFSELMQQQAKAFDKLAVIRSIHHDSSSHGTSAHLTQTGYYLRNNQNRSNDMPCAGSVASRVKGASAPGIPAYVALGRTMRFGEAAYLGKAFNPFVVSRDPSASNFQVDNLDLVSGLTSNRIDGRRNLLDQLDSSRRLRDTEGVSESVDQFTTGAYEMVTSGRALEAFQIDKEPDAARDRYGRNQTGQSMLLARRLVEAGVTFVSIRTGSWDDHNGIEKRMKDKGPSFDQGLAALIEDLHQRGRDRDVMVVAMGEFGRTPRINNNAGRDHWGRVMSVMMAGGGLRTGQIIGRSNNKGEVPQDNPYRPENVLAMVYRHLGIDTKMTFPDLAGRPRYILEDDALIHELV